MILWKSAIRWEQVYIIVALEMWVFFFGFGGVDELEPLLDPTRLPKLRKWITILVTMATQVKVVHAGKTTHGGLGMWI